MTSDSEERQVQITMGLTMREAHGEEMALRQVILGGNPIILIEPVSSTDETYRLEADVTGFDNKEEVAEMLEMIVNGLRTGKFATEE